MKKLIPMFAICALTAACAGTGAIAPSTEMPSTTQTTGAPAPSDTNAPTDKKPIPPLNTTTPTTNPSSASMQDTTSQSAGDAPVPMHAPASTP